jgi:hypothetical protein
MPRLHQHHGAEIGLHAMPPLAPTVVAMTRSHPGPDLLRRKMAIRSGGFSGPIEINFPLRGVRGLLFG